MKEELYGYIERITFQNAENGFAVAWLKSRKSRELICLVGVMGTLQPGETVRVRGEWQHHLVHGRQFSVDICQNELPADVEGIRRYLGSGLVKGIGPTYAGRIVETFGEETLRVIDQTPERLREIEGIGKKRIDQITSSWIEQSHVREVMIFLQGQGISPRFAQKIYKRYGNDSIHKIKEDPYRLAKEIRGVGFKSADKIAEKLGFEKESPARLRAGLFFTLETLSEEGSTCAPKEVLIERAAELLEVSPDLLFPALEEITKEDLVRQAAMPEKEEPYIWLKPLFLSEMGIAREIKRILYGVSKLRDIDTVKAVEWVQALLDIELAPLQQKAVKKAVSGKCLILTGGPGTGKSTITNAILKITEKLTSRTLLAAPTGKAAKRMSEITQKKASTIHSLLEYDFKAGGFKRGADNPLEADLIIVDEASMIDTHLMYQLLKAIPDHARLVFVGDVNQLPSVGPGNVLMDLINSKKVPVTVLKEIFRQAAGSTIIVNAHRINDGIFPDLSNEPDSDFFFIEAETPELASEEILSLVTKRLPQKYHLDPIDEIQVLAPMKKGVVGTENLNLLLQKQLIGERETLFLSGVNWHVGDKVMQLRNNYTKEVFNGDVGRVVRIDTGEQQVFVQFDHKVVSYDSHDLDELQLSYAVSIHKFQGSECPCIVMPIHTTHFKMLHRNLIYTGVTRGKKLVVVVGTKKAIAIGVKNDEVRLRYTGLKEFICSETVFMDIS